VNVAGPHSGLVIRGGIWRVTTRVMQGCDA
jgi:hypothetical protein